MTLAWSKTCAAVSGILWLLMFDPVAKSQNLKPEPRILTPVSSRELAVPRFVPSLDTKCDSDGKLYFHLVGGNYPDNILILSSDGQQGRILRLSGEFEGRFAGFSVSPSGDLYLLANKDQRYFAITFDSNDKMNEPTPLELPEDIIATDFGVFENGSFLVFGYHDERAAAKLRGESYGAVLDPSGRRRRQFRPRFSVNLANVGDQLHEGGVAASPNGSLYLVAGNEIVVVSAAGEITRKISFRKPDPDDVILGIRASSRSVVLGFAHLQNGAVDRRIYLVLHADGKPDAQYVPSEQIAHADDVCFSDDTGFTFLKLDRDGKAALMAVPLQ